MPPAMWPSTVPRRRSNIPRIRAPAPAASDATDKAAESTTANRFYDLKDGSPLIYTYLAYFGALFAIVRWWKQADPLRGTRLSLWTTGFTVFAAWMVDWFWSFPQPWGVMTAAIISTSVQLVSPFVPEHERSDRQSREE